MLEKMDGEQVEPHKVEVALFAGAIAVQLHQLKWHTYISCDPAVILYTHLGCTTERRASAAERHVPECSHSCTAKFITV